MSGPITWARFGPDGLAAGTHCYYCARALDEVREKGCGSEEFRPQARADELCEVYQQVRRMG